jgi:hypothetical protein
VNRRSALALAALGAAATMAAASPALGQLAAQAVPMKLNLTVRPGAPVIREVAIANQGTVPVIVTVRYADWGMTEDGDLQLLPPGTQPQSLAGHVSVEPSSFSLQPLQTGRFSVKLTLPDDGVETRWGVLLSEVRPAFVNRAALGPRAIAELGTTLYLSRRGAQEIQPDVTGMRVTPLGGDSLQVTVEVRNDGARHFYVSGRLALRDASGEVRTGGALPTGVVLPGTTRRFSWASRAGLSPGDYIAAATLDTGLPELIIGERRFRWPPEHPIESPVASSGP